MPETDVTVAVISELLLLLDAAHADRVGAVDDLRLGTITPLRLGVAPFGLDAGEGVERRDERDVELVLDAVRRNSAQPVVGVNDVGAAVRPEVIEHPVGELVDDGLRLQLGGAEAAVCAIGLEVGGLVGPAGSEDHAPLPRQELVDGA